MILQINYDIYSSMQFWENLRNRKNLAVKGWRVPHARTPYLEIFVDWDKTYVNIKIFLRSCIETSTKTWIHPPTHPHPKLNYFELQSAAGGALFSQGSKVNLLAFTRTETCQGLAVCHLKWRSRHLKFSNFEHCAHCAPFSDFEALLARK